MNRFFHRAHIRDRLLAIHRPDCRCHRRRRIQWILNRSDADIHPSHGRLLVGDIDDASRRAVVGVVHHVPYNTDNGHPRIASEIAERTLQVEWPIAFGLSDTGEIQIPPFAFRLKLELEPIILKVKLSMQISNRGSVYFYLTNVQG